MKHVEPDFPSTQGVHQKYAIGKKFGKFRNILEGWIVEEKQTKNTLVYKY